MTEYLTNFNKFYGLYLSSQNIIFVLRLLLLLVFFRVRSSCVRLSRWALYALRTAATVGIRTDERAEEGRTALS
jgi:hypothetical protein